MFAVHTAVLYYPEFLPDLQTEFISHKTRMLVDMGIVEKYTVLGLCHASDLRRGVNGYVDPRHAKDMSSEEEHQYVTASEIHIGKGDTCGSRKFRNLLGQPLSWLAEGHASRVSVYASRGILITSGYL
jgi:hypothetical protein